MEGELFWNLSLKALWYSWDELFFIHDNFLIFDEVKSLFKVIFADFGKNLTVF